MSAAILTDRLILRPPKAEDVGFIARYLNDFEVSGNLASVPFPYGLADAQNWFLSRPAASPPEDGNFTIELRGMGYAGHIGFQAGAEGPVLGYWLGRPFWGRGIMTEAARATIAWLFEASATTVIRSGVFHFNTASLAVQKKLGFTETGRSRLLCLARDAEVEHIDTQLTRAHFAAAQPAAHADRGKAGQA